MPGTRLSITEKKLKRWWDSTPDQPHACLSAITVKGSPGLRGISDLELVFKYPISVICGRNGAGKSTILALAALAFEPPTGCASYNAIKRTRKIKGHPEDVYYYTFGDFFYKGPRDPDISGVTIQWSYTGAPFRKLIKKQSSKWMRYETRPKRPVHFIGLSRAIHPIEQKSLRGHFNGSMKSSKKNWTDLSPDMLSRFAEIVGKQYDEASSLSNGANKTINSCKAGSAYSGFNMGSGEDIVLGILSLIDEIPKGGLIVIEEIEVGLFPQAQHKLMKHLLELAWEKKLQVIITTHSDHIIDQVPREARIMLQASLGTPHEVTYSPSTRYATGSMLGTSQHEAAILCEDTFAKIWIRELISMKLSKRLTIDDIGSCSELPRAAAYKAKSSKNEKLILAFDGDVKRSDIRKWFAEERCKEVFTKPANQQRVSSILLPGLIPPERFVASELMRTPQGLEALASELNCTEFEAKTALEQCLTEEDEHVIPYALAQHANISSKDLASQQLSKAFAHAYPATVESISSQLTDILDSNGDGEIKWDEIYPKKEHRV